MMIKFFLKTVLINLLFLFAKPVFAQYDLSFTQYMFNETFINPAYSGSQEALSLSASYRNQWVGIEGAPVSQTLVAHTPLTNKRIGFGLAIANEKAGVFKRTGAYGNFAYRIIMRKSTLAFGLLAGVQSTREEFSKINTADKTVPDPEFMLNAPTIIRPNFGFGMYYYNQKFYAGVSVPRFIKTNTNTTQTKSTVELKNFSYYLIAGYMLNLNDNFKLRPSVMTNLIIGAPLNTNIALNALLKNVLWVGVNYKTSNTIAGLLGFQASPQFRISYSYDYTMSELQKGSHEINLSYLFSFSKEKITTPRLF